MTHVEGARTLGKQTPNVMLTVISLPEDHEIHQRCSPTIPK